ncbi:MAG: cobaltochelatase subunit CobT, partial [Pseudomonadota bacterium]
MSDQAKQHEAFKRALAATTRALSSQPEVEVSYGGERALAGDRRARLPNPALKMAPGELAQTRGEADATALKLAHHSDACHFRHRPPGEDARAIFDALEDARVCSIGANAMRGVSENLSANLEKACGDKGYGRMEDRQDAPL